MNEENIIDNTIDPMDKFEYKGEMALIYPKYYAEKVPKIRFKVMVIQENDGDIPHIHMEFLDAKDEKREKRAAYICLHKAMYAPNHDNRKLDDLEKEELIKFLNTFRKGASAVNSAGKHMACNCWKEAVYYWNVAYSDTLFEKDKNGNIIMPDYTKL